MLNLIRSYLGKLFTFLFKKYPGLYKGMDYFCTNLAVFNVYLYSTVFKLHNRFKNNFTILYSITVYIYSEYLGIVNGNLSRNIGVIISLYVLYDPTYSNILLFAVLLLSVLFKEHLIKEVWIRSNYPILYRVLLDISTLINTLLICYFLDLIFINTIKPFILKLWNGLLKMTGNEDNHNNASGSDADKTPGESPQEPKNNSDSEYYVNNKGKRVKRRKLSEQQKKKKNERERGYHEKKVLAQGKKVIKRESLAGLTEEEKKERIHQRRRKNILEKRDEDFQKYPILKDITPRRKNKNMSKEEKEEFDRISIENRKKSRAKYWDANKHRIELKRPGRSSREYRDEHNLYEDPNYVKPLESKKNVRFVQSNSKGKEKQILAEETLPEESLPEEFLHEEVLDKGKGKAKVNEETNSSSGSDYSAELFEDSDFENDTNKAMRKSRNSYNKKGESSKKGGSK